MHVSVEDDFQSGFVVIMRRASVIAYMKFLDPIFSVFVIFEIRWAEMSV